MVHKNHIEIAVKYRLTDLCYFGNSFTLRGFHLIFISEITENEERFLWTQEMLGIQHSIAPRMVLNNSQGFRHWQCLG